ncbi:phage tail assembly chaperone [Paraburkholderia sp. BR10936]|uniref:phage tail assembly chaperone n=1 Tax=Paraburkholderia sp. BR10936 TaxID=3236993 RepID=UPI0034D24939
MDAPVRETERAEKAERKITLGDVTYVFMLAPAEPAFDMLLEHVTPLLQGFTVPLDKAGHISEWPVGRFAAGLSSPDARVIREFLYKYIAVARSGGQPFRLEDDGQRAVHFNHYRGHMIPLILKAFQFQFDSFFDGGVLAQILPRQMVDTLRAKLSGFFSGQ